MSWLIDTTRGVSLPPEKIIKDAEVALKIVESAIKANDLKKLQMAMKYAEAPIDKAISVMGKYHDNWTKGAGNWITGCEVTKTVSFTIVAVAGAPIAASAGAGAVASGAIASGGAALLEAVAHETGTALAGSETQTVGSAAWNVFKKTLISAGIGAVLKGKYAEKIVEGVGAQLVKRTGSSVLKRFVTSEKTITVLVRKVLKNASVSGLESAMEETVKLMTDPKAKPEEFFATVAKKMATGGFLGELDGLVEKNLAPGIVDKIPAGRFAEVFGNMSKKNAAKFIEGMITKSYGNAIESAFDSAVTKMTGKETPKQLVDNVAKNFAKSRAMNEVLDDLMEKYGDKIRK